MCMMMSYAPTCPNVQVRRAAHTLVSTAATTATYLEKASVSAAIKKILLSALLTNSVYGRPMVSPSMHAHLD